MPGEERARETATVVGRHDLVEVILEGLGEAADDHGESTNMSADNPYTSLPRESFWRSAVAARLPGEPFSDLWTPKFALGTEDRFLTAGSCFAQHISGWLRRSGYTWLDSEPAPDSMPLDERTGGGYGVFSWRTGNIYTPALLRRWVELAFQESPSVGELIVEDDRYFDPLRPTIPRAGFDSPDSLALAREATLRAIRESVEKGTVFIFTLGLTEAWVDARGDIYASCPGTVRGRFDPGLHRFKNFSYPEIVRDLAAALDVMRGANSGLKFILTVSPVPLTATAAGEHVLVATTDSKAVLRAAAGDLARRSPDIDYFPSYEIIAATPSKGAFFADNLRSVTPAGVDFVMRHFELGLQGGARRTPAVARVAIPTAAREDVICDEVLLDSWAHGDSASADICLIGDSHLGKLSMRLAARGVAHAGGMIMNGSAWADDQLHLDPEDLLVPLESRAARARWTLVLPFFASPPAAGAPKVVVTNVGMQSHRNVHLKLTPYLAENQGSPGDDGLLDFFLAANAKQVSLCVDLLKRGYTVVALTDPPVQHLDPDFQGDPRAFELYDSLYSIVFGQIGCVVINAREAIAESGFRGNLLSDIVYADGGRDWMHGSAEYYDLIADRVIEIATHTPDRPSGD